MSPQRLASISLLAIYIMIHTQVFKLLEAWAGGVCLQGSLARLLPISCTLTGSHTACYERRAMQEAASQPALPTYIMKYNFPT